MCLRRGDPRRHFLPKGTGKLERTWTIRTETLTVAPLLLLSPLPWRATIIPSSIGMGGKVHGIDHEGYTFQKQKVYWNHLTCTLEPDALLTLS
jgi:hypothetical protein